MGTWLHKLFNKTSWKHSVEKELRYIRSHIESMHELNFLSPNEVSSYKSGITHLHESLQYVGKTVAITGADDCIGITTETGECIGYGVLINNAMCVDSVNCITRKFIVLRSKGEEKVCIIEPNMRIFTKS